MVPQRPAGGARNLLVSIGKSASVAKTTRVANARKIVIGKEKRTEIIGTVIAIMKGNETGLGIMIAIVAAQGTITVTTTSMVIGPHAIMAGSETRTMNATRTAIVIGPPSTTGRRTGNETGMETTRNVRVRALIIT